VKANVKTKSLLACGVIGGPLFVAAFLVEGAIRANYNPLRHPVCSLALGDSGWIKEANFIVAGLPTLAFSAGLRRASAGEGLDLGTVAVWGMGGCRRAKGAESRRPSGCGGTDLENRTSTCCGGVTAADSTLNMEFAF
jgi:hypothetical protein